MPIDDTFRQLMQRIASDDAQVSFNATNAGDYATIRSSYDDVRSMIEQLDQYGIEYAITDAGDNPGVEAWIER